VNDLREQILEVARAHAATAKAAYSSRDCEVETLRKKITELEAERLLLEDRLSRARAEVMDLRAALRRLP